MIRDQFLKTIQKFRMIEKGETVLVAVSGGQDSVTLLHLLVELKKTWKLKLTILHVNHRLRGKASDQDEAFVRKLAKQFKLPIYVTHAQVKEKSRDEKISLEEAAREVRYQFFEKVLEIKRAHKIAVAHTQDDQAETVLMRVITGTGLQGLQAIRPKRKLGGAYLVRPFIEIPRSEILKFAKINRIRFREDASNRSLQFLRNRIRLKLIPYIERLFNPQVKKALARLPHLLDVDLAFLDETSEIFYRRLAKQKNSDEILFPKQSFLRLKLSVQYRLINRALRALADAELDFDHWNVFLESLTSQSRFQLQMPKGLFVSATPNAIRIKKSKKLPSSFSHSLSLGETLYIPETDVTLSCNLMEGKLRVVRKTDRSFDLFDASKLSFPLTIRNRKPGDRFQPLGQAKPLKLKRFLINKRIPAEKRDLLPLVLSGNVIAWVGGVAMADVFKVNSNTKQFVRIALASENRV
ncbi:MAG: tRNA lysidine(34) synthetase TilS [Candidatus Omnitrophica bacterium]|nr:tRNA lysidine(34) synthetase TilS [Candidatus Omnitrophota bacterium]